MLVINYFNKLGVFCCKHRNFIISALILFCIGVFISALVPPFQSPDEQDHLKRAYLLSKGRIAMETPAGESTGGYIDTGLNSYMGAYNHLPFKVNNKVTADVKSKAATITWSGDEKFGSSPGINYYLPFIYLPQTVGLLIGQMVNLSIEDSYYLARYLALLSSIVVILLAFSINRPNAFVVAMLLMPLMIFQLVSTSQDGFAIALLILCLSIFCKITNSRSAYEHKYFYAMSIIIFLLVTSRINLLPMLALPFAVIALTTKAKKEYFFSIVISCLTIAWIAYALNTTVDNRVTIGASTKEIIVFYLQSPFEFIKVLFSTFTNSSLREFYVTSFVGILGWLDTRFESVHISIILFSLIIILFASISLAEIRKDLSKRTVLIIVAITSFLLTFFLLLITWTEHPATTVSGVQGRYLWGPIILLAYGITVPLGSLSRIKQLVCVIGLACILVVVVMNLPRVLLDRYYLANATVYKLPITLNLNESESVVTKLKSSTKPEQGGFIDSVNFVSGGVRIEGWGFFSEDKKIFLSNRDEPIEIKYKSKIREDVANAYKDDSLLYSGFSIFVNGGNAELLTNICFYTEDPVFGIRQVMPGNKDMLYKCANK